MTNRRQFMKNAGLGIGAFSIASALPRLALAAEKTDRYFIAAYFEGGWDALLSLDPRDPTVFTDAVLPETGIQPAFDLQPANFSRQLVKAGPFTFGPCVGELTDVASDISLVRGINMATLTHEVGRRYFITGRPPVGLNARGSSVSSLVANQLGGDRPVPHLACAVESYAQELPAYAAAMPVASVGHMRYILRRYLGIPTPIGANVTDALASYWSKSKPLDGASGSSLSAIYRDNRARAAELVKSTLYQQFEFDSAATAEVRGHYGFNAGSVESPFGRAALAAQALKSGLSRVVSVQLANRLDTHGSEWANDHGRFLADGFTALARLIQDLKTTEAPGGGSMLDKTTILAFSEFTRTARLNERNGRDHNLSNCALLAGAGIKPGAVAGSTSDNGMGPNLINLATGQATEDGISLKPEHVMTTVMQAMGLDSEELRSEPIQNLLA